jgi:hypothetical protein
MNLDRACDALQSLPTPLLRIAYRIACLFDRTESNHAAHLRDQLRIR